MDLTEQTIPAFLSIVEQNLADAGLFAPFIRSVVEKVLRQLRKLGYRVRRWRLDAVKGHFQVYDLRQQGLTGDEIAEGLWPEQWEKGDGGRVLDDKSKLIQRVYDREKAAKRLIGLNTHGTLT
jgi:hypothetical protein